MNEKVAYYGNIQKTFITISNHVHIVVFIYHNVCHIACVGIRLAHVNTVRKVLLDLPQRRWLCSCRQSCTYGSKKCSLYYHSLLTYRSQKHMRTCTHSDTQKQKPTCPSGRRTGPLLTIFVLCYPYYVMSLSPSPSPSLSHTECACERESLCVYSCLYMHLKGTLLLSVGILI